MDMTRPGTSAPPAAADFSMRRAWRGAYTLRVTCSPHGVPGESDVEPGTIAWAEAMGARYCARKSITKGPHSLICGDVPGGM